MVITMTVSSLLEIPDFSGLCIVDPQRKISGVYAGDLLSWVMGHASEGQCLITIMSNVNTVAVATLCDVSTVILAEGVTLDEGVLAIAHEKVVNLLSSPMSAYELSVSLSGVIS